MNNPTNWLLTKLEEFFCWSNGKNLTKEKMTGGEYLVYGGNGITGTHNTWLCKQEGIAIGRVGAHCGNVNLIPPHSWITDNAIYTSWKTTNIHLRFFYYLLESYKLNELAGGSGQPYLSQTILNSLLIPLPPLNEQKRIVAKIEALKTRSNAVKEELEGIKPLLEQFRKSVLAAAFRGDLTKDWREQNPDVEANKIKLQSPITIEKDKGIIPNTWQWSLLTEIANLESGHTPRKSRVNARKKKIKIS